MISCLDPWRRVVRAFPLACLFVAIIGFDATVRAATPEVSAIRFGINPPRTRVVIDIDQFVRFEASRLEDPERLIVDLPDTRWRIRPSPDSRPKGITTNYHFGKHEPGTSRLVVDVETPFKIVRTITLEPDANVAFYRLVVDIEPLEPTVARPRTPALPPANSVTNGYTPPVPGEPRITAQPALRPPLGGEFADERQPVIVLDAGHGGRDPGAIGVNGIFERDITLRMAHQLADVLRETGRYEVLLTREDNRFISLPGRIKIAREAGGDLFISIHADSIGKPEQRGASVYTLSETASDEEAAKLAREENKTDIIYNADLTQHDAFVTSILIDLAQRDTNNKSIVFAEELVDQLGDTTKLVRRTRRYAGFAVLKAPDIPSVLLELGYLSNLEDAALLMDKNHRDRLARAIVEAIDNYFSTLG